MSLNYVQNNYVNENGEQYIPASQRPDGTWRKARRVKEGYVPQEEVPLYESKGKQFMNKKNEPVRLPSGQTAKMTIPGLFIVEEDKQGKKKGNKKSIQKESKTLCDSFNDLKVTEETEKAKEISLQDPQKKLKNLKKRLREVEALEEKIKNGTLTKPEPEQLTKLKRKNDLLMQIRELEKSMN